MYTLYTIGYSNRTWEEFLKALEAHDIKHIIDVRTIPKSRRLPLFNQDKLILKLSLARISYQHLPKLGGLRHTKKDSINMGWHNTSFRGFADYMQTPEFYSGLKELDQLLKAQGKTAIMCAEVVPWRCHRSLIADAEVVRNVKVLHIISESSLQEHRLTDFAVVNRNTTPIQIYYPDKNLDLDL